VLDCACTNSHISDFSKVCFLGETGLGCTPAPTLRTIANLDVKFAISVREGIVMQTWFVLFLAGLAEIGWVIGLKYSQGFTRLAPSAFTVVSLAASMLLLGWAVRSLPIGTAYAVWTGIGAIGAAVAGLMLFGESTNPVRLLCIGLIIAGVAGLKLSTPG
jgi:quaternary ammonium compound-resistance protein SugE